MEEIKEIFKKRKQRQVIITIIAVLAVVLLYIFNLQSAAVVIVVGVLIFTRYNWRCPKCNKYLSRGSNPKHCSSCGEELQ